jgi:hypothetical protein
MTRGDEGRSSRREFSSLYVSKAREVDVLEDVCLLGRYGSYGQCSSCSEGDDHSF